MIAALIALALQAAPDPTLGELERAYDQTCNNRIYGQFDDLCSDMEDRIKAYRRELKRRPRGNATPPSPASPAPPPRSPAMPDAASTPNPAPPKDAAAFPPSPEGAGSSGGFTRAFESVRDASAGDPDLAEIAADDAGATALAEEIGAGSQKPRP